MNNDLGLEDEFVSDRLGTTHRAIDVFRTGEFQGTHNERLRIIKLLESNNKLCTEKTVCIEANEGYPCLCTDLIALIKGEQK